MFRDYLFDYFISSYSSQTADGTIQLGGFNANDVKQFPKHPLSTPKAIFAGIGAAVISSIILCITSGLGKSKKKSRDSPGSAAPQGIGSLYLAVFLDSFGAMMLLPFLGILAIEFGCDAFQTSCLGAVFAATQFVGTGILGVLADKTDKKLILLWTLGMCALCILFSGISVHLPTGNHKEVLPNPLLNHTETAACSAGTAAGGKTEGGDCYTEQTVVTGTNYAYFFLLLTRALAGFFASTVSVIQTIVAERSSEEQRTQNIAMVMGFFGLGMVGGPLIGGFLYDYGIETLCYSAGALTLVNLVYAKIQLVEQPPSKASETNDNDEAAGKFAVRDALKVLCQKPITSILLIATFLATGGMSLWMTAASLFNIAIYKWSGTQIGMVMGISGVMMFIAQIFIAGPSTNLLGDGGCIIVGNAFRAVCIFVYVIRAPWLPWVLFPFATITNALVDAQLQSMMTALSPPHSLGTLLGVMQSLRSLSEAVCPPLGGWLLDSSYDTPFYASGSMAVICVVILVPKVLFSSGEQNNDVKTMLIDIRNKVDQISSKLEFVNAGPAMVAKRELPSLPAQGVLDIVIKPIDLVGSWSSAEEGNICIIETPMGVYAGFGDEPESLFKIAMVGEQIELNGWKLVDRSKKSLRWQKPSSYSLVDGQLIEQSDIKDGPIVTWQPKA